MSGAPTPIPTEETDAHDARPAVLRAPATCRSRARRARSSATASTRRRSRWPGDARVAVQIVVNYEEGSEKTFAMGDGENDILYELPFKLDDQRDLAVESMYEYGTRAGIWRMFRIFDAAGIPVTFFAAAVALERNIEVAKKLAARGDEAAEPRLPLVEPLRDDARGGARGHPARGRVDHRAPSARGRSAGTAAR